MSFLSPIGVVYSVENLENKFFFSYICKQQVYKNQ